MLFRIVENPIDGRIPFQGILFYSMNECSVGSSGVHVQTGFADLTDICGTLFGVCVPRSEDDRKDCRWMGIWTDETDVAVWVEANLGMN
jgi:hypothetical protein